MNIQTRLQIDLDALDAIASRLRGMKGDDDLSTLAAQELENAVRSDAPNRISGTKSRKGEDHVR